MVPNVNYPERSVGTTDRQRVARRRFARRSSYVPAIRKGYRPTPVLPLGGNPQNPAQSQRRWAGARPDTRSRPNGNGPCDQSYIEDGIQLLELASDAHQLFIEQEPKEKRRLLEFMVSNASWKEGELSANLRQPFNLIRDGVAAATSAERSATNKDRSQPGRVLALSNSPKRPISNSREVGLGPPQSKMANWLSELAPDQVCEFTT